MSICRLGSLVFLCALAGLVILTLVQQSQQQQEQEVELAAPGERGFRQSLTPVSPVVLRFQPCRGFAEQQLQLAKALLVGSSLGAQIALPRAGSKRGDNVWDLFNMPLLLESAQSIFRNILCERPPGAERRFWCRESPVPAILLLDADQWASVTNGREKFQIDNVEQLDFVYHRLWKSRPSMSIVSATCSILLHLPVIEPGVRWNLFWQLFGSMEFTQDVQRTARSIAQLMPTYVESAQKNAASMGYERNQDKTVFNVLHLRAEPDWSQFCSSIFVPKGQSNCMNNTFEVANVLLSEGITPSIPIYLATGLNEDQLASWRSASTVPFATQSLFKVYTLVTQEMLSEVIFAKWKPDCRHHRMFWPAISYLLGIDAQTFIGNSVSTFSGLLLQRRAQNKQRSIYYNGGGVRLQETEQLKPKQRLTPRTLRSPIKWIFCIHPEKGDVESPRFKAAKVAIKSALSKTTLVPVGVTTADPRSKLATTLVAMGTRLIFHIPKWGSQVKSMKVKNQQDKNSLGRCHHQSLLRQWEGCSTWIYPFWAFWILLCFIQSLMFCFKTTCHGSGCSENKLTNSNVAMIFLSGSNSSPDPASKGSLNFFPCPLAQRGLEGHEIQESCSWTCWVCEVPILHLCVLFWAACPNQCLLTALIRLVSGALLMLIKASFSQMDGHWQPSCLLSSAGNRIGRRIQR